MRRPLLASLILLSVALSWAATPARLGGSPAAPDDTEAAETPERHMEVVQVEGAIDPVVADLIQRSIRRAQTNGATVVILQINSNGALDTDPLALIDAVRTSKVPIATWVGPGKATARRRGGGARGRRLVLRRLAERPPRPHRSVPPGREAVERRRGSPPAPRPADAGRVPDRRPRQYFDRRASGTRAAEAGAIDVVAPTLGDLIVGLHGQEVPTAAGPVRLSTAKQIDTKDGPRQTADQPVRFLKLGTFASVQHSLTSPSVAFLLLMVGLALMVFEFFTIGIGLAGLTGAAAVAGSFFGFSHLPVNGWALALLLLSTFGFAIDVQAGHQGFWTGIGAVGLLAGSAPSVRRVGRPRRAAVAGGPDVRRADRLHAGGHDGGRPEPVLHPDRGSRLDDRRARRGPHRARIRTGS